MSQVDETLPIGDDELLYRRLPVSTDWYDPNRCPILSPQGFRPRRDDDTGLSLVRGNPFNTAEQAARGPSAKGYFVAVFRAGDLRDSGIAVVPKPVPGISGHVEIPSLNTANRDTEEARAVIEILTRRLCLRVEGPFHVQT